MSQKILIVDDEAILTKTFTRLLEKQGYCAKTALSGKEAFEITSREEFDMILSDIRMPGENGVETIHKIQQKRTKSGKKPVPVIFLTGYADKTLEAEAATLNPIAYIYKPFDALKLLEIIRSHFNTA